MVSHAEAATKRNMAKMTTDLRSIPCYIPCRISSWTTIGEFVRAQSSICVFCIFDSFLNHFCIKFHIYIYIFLFLRYFCIFLQNQNLIDIGTESCVLTRSECRGAGAEIGSELRAGKKPERRVDLKSKKPERRVEVDFA